MMIKAKDVLGRRVIAKDKGEKIASVSDVLYDPENQRVAGLLTGKKGWFKEAKVVLTEDVESFGQDAVMVASERAVKQASDIPGRIAGIAESNDRLEKTHIVTEDGTKLGRVTDIYFNTETGEVNEMEVTQGKVRDMMSGKKRISTDQIMRVGADAVIVRSYAEQTTEEQQGGLKEKYEEGKERVKDMADTQRERMEEEEPNLQSRLDRTQEKMKESFSQAKQTLREKAHDAKDQLMDRGKDEAVGKYATVNVLDHNDDFIVKRGEMITNNVVEKAEKEGQLRKLVTHTSKEPIA